MIDETTYEEKLATLDDDYLRQCVRITPEAMSQEYMQLPGVLAYWNAQYARTNRAYLDAKLDVAVTRARLQPLVRDALLRAGAKVTESQVEAAIDSNEDMIDAIRRMNAADALKHEAFGIVDTIRAKREMLISLGAHVRAEMAHDPVVREYAKSQRMREE
jgi:hypothetical protein